MNQPGPCKLQDVAINEYFYFADDETKTIYESLGRGFYQTPDGKIQPSVKEPIQDLSADVVEVSRKGMNDRIRDLIDEQKRMLHVAAEPDLRDYRAKRRAKIAAEFAEAQAKRLVEIRAALEAEREQAYDWATLREDEKIDFDEMEDWDDDMGD